MSTTIDSTIAPNSGREPSFSFVLEHPAAEPTAANRHFVSRLAVETDPSDVKLDLDRGHPGIVVVDARSTEAWRKCHIPGSISLPHRTIGPDTTAMLPREKVIVTYCWGPGCNAATKAAAKLGALGFRVKEMIGGLEYWRHEGSPVEGTEGTSAGMFG